MPDDVTNLDLKPSDLTKPKKLMNKGIAVAELGLGGFSAGAIRNMIQGKIPMSKLALDGLMTLGSMLVAGYVDQNDISNYVGGVTAASASSLAEEIVNWLRGKMGPASNMNLKTAEAPILPESKNMGGGAFYI